VSTVNIRLRDRTAIGAVTPQLKAQLGTSDLAWVSWQELLPQVHEMVGQQHFLGRTSNDRFHSSCLKLRESAQGRSQSVAPLSLCAETRVVRLAPIPRCGHFPMYSTPMAMWRELRDFVGTAQVASQFASGQRRC
jgi:hypothetical protein